MKNEIDKISAIPSKRIYRSIIADYDLKKSICELIDNAIDNWNKKDKKELLEIEIDFDLNQNTICVSDNSGGIAVENLKWIISPGETGNKTTKDLIGLFGVGTKRAVVALSQNVCIKTRFGSGKTFMVEFDDNWLSDEDWDLSVYEVDDIKENNTIIELSRLRYHLDEIAINELVTSLKSTYGIFLENDKLVIKIDGKQLTPIIYDLWAYPPDYSPREFLSTIKVDDRNVNLKIIAGLKRESSPAAGEYGVYFYCNKRLIAKALKNAEMGFVSGLAGLPHPKVSLIQILVFLEGDANLMPWNSSKSDIDYNHLIFRSLRDLLISIVKDCSSLSRRLEGQWPDKVFKFTSGEIEKVNVEINDIKKSYLPPLPKTRIRFEDTVKENNEKMISKKPWVAGICDAVIASDLISKQKLNERGRIELIILDSTLEISFKEYLVNDSGQFYTDTQLLNMFSKRHLVHAEIKKYVKISKANWKKINHYYNLRCKLVHERATVGITDTQIKDFRNTVEHVLKKLFNLNF